MSSINISSNQSWFNTPNQNLKGYVNTLFSKNTPLGVKSIKGIITPHAGIIYSGVVSAFMYNYLLQNIILSKIKNINLVIFCTNHYLNTSDLITTDSSFIKFKGNENENDVPRIDINNKITGELYTIGTNILMNNEAFIQEHSFINQLPFLEYIIDKTKSKKTVKIVPIIVGSYKISSQLENELNAIINRPSTYVIVSTDFNHVGPRFRTQIPSTTTLRKMDQLAIDFIINKEYHYLEKGLSVCGAKALILLDKIRNIKRNNLETIVRKTSFDSKETTGTWETQKSIVSYLGIIIL
jgi:AmmeMemoRadiSam system protein B